VLITHIVEGGVARLVAGANHLAGRWVLVVEGERGRSLLPALGVNLSGVGAVLTRPQLCYLRDECTRALGEHHGSGPDFITIIPIDVVHFECASPTEPQVPHVTLCYGTCVRCGKPVQLGDKCVDVPRMTSEGAPR
jgi:hypothetical protein